MRLETKPNEAKPQRQPHAATCGQRGEEERSENILRCGRARMGASLVTPRRPGDGRGSSGFEVRTIHGSMRNLRGSSSAPLWARAWTVLHHRGSLQCARVLGTRGVANDPSTRQRPPDQLVQDPASTASRRKRRRRQRPKALPAHPLAIAGDRAKLGRMCKREPEGVLARSIPRIRLARRGCGRNRHLLPWRSQLLRSRTGQAGLGPTGCGACAGSAAALAPVAPACANFRAL